MIRFASWEMKKTLMEHWLLSYPKDERYLPVFFDHCFAPERTAVVIGEEGIEASAYFLPCAFHVAGKRLPFMFWYAGNTLPRFRGRGHYKAIIAFFSEYGQANGYAGAVFHGSAMGAAICDRLGIPAPLMLYQTEWIPNDITGMESPQVQWRPCGLERFRTLRARYVDAMDKTFIWQEDILAFIYRDILFSGELLWGTLHGEECYAVVERQGSGLFVREAGCPQERVTELLKSVCTTLNYEGPVTVQTRNPLGKNSAAVYAGHVQLFDEDSHLQAALMQGAYFNLYAS